MDGKAMVGKGRREERIKPFSLSSGNKPCYNHNQRFSYKGRGRQNERFHPYRQEAYEAYTPQIPNKGNTDRSRKYPRDPNKYHDFHKKLGHATEDCENLKREKREKPIT